MLVTFSLSACAHHLDATVRVVEQTTPYHLRVEIPVLGGSMGAGAATINAYFADRLEREYGCASTGTPTDGSYVLTAKVTVVRGNLLGITREFEASCGGPHPDSGTSALFFDLRTGAQVDLDARLDAARRARLVQTYLARPEKADPDCADTLSAAALVNDGFDFVPRGDGLEVSPRLPYAVRACANAARFTWAELDSLLDLSAFR